MAIPFLNNINLSDNELQNAKLHVTSTAPTAAAAQIYFDSTPSDLTAKYYSNSTDQWVSLKEYSFPAVTPANGYVTSTITGTFPKPIITFNLNAVNGTASANERYLTKNNTWAEVSGISGTTYDLEGVGSTDGTAGIRLKGSDDEDDDVLIIGAGTTTVTRNANILTVTSNDEFDGTVESVNFTTDGTALNVVSNTITTSGTMTGVWQGNSSQYVNGEGDLQPFPTIPTVNDGTLTVQGTGALSGTGTFTANQSGDSDISVIHNAFGTAGTYAYPSSVTTNSTGHITAITAGSAPATPSDATITLAAGSGLITGGAFTLDQATNETITFDIGSGDGITVNDNDVAVDVDDVTIQIAGGEVAAKTAAVVNAGTALATGDQIYDFVTGQIANIPSGLSFEGNWNADTDTPDLSGATPDNGQFWIVSVAGSTNLDGITDWKVGDWAIYVSTGAGTDGWQKVDNTSTLSGSGIAGQLTYWTGTANVAGDAGLTYDAATDALSVGGDGIFGGTLEDDNGNGVQWTDAYNNYVASAAVTGGANKIMTFTQRDGGTFTADWTDNGSEGTVTNIATTGPITGGPITDTGTIGIVTASAGTIGAGAVAAGTGISVAYASGIATVTNTDTNTSNTFSGLIGNGTLTSLTITSATHQLGTDSTSFMIQLVEVSSGETVYADVTRGASGLVTIVFAVAPTSNSIRVLIQKIG
jgi:hypothetical protein